MKKLLCLSSIAALGLITQVAHADFNAELSGTVSNDDDVKLGGSYYFQQVSTRKGPLAEANFLDKQSSVDAVFSRIDSGDDNVNSWLLGGTYVFQGSGLYLTAAVTHFNGLSSDSYTMGGGYYLSKDWAVSIGTQFDDDMDYQGVTFASKKLFNLGGDHFVSLDGSYTNPDLGDDSFTVASDFYLNRNLSVGLGYAWADSFGDGTSSVRSQWFINDRVAVNGQVSYVDYEGESDTSYMLGATMRF
ncbi:putative porin [Paraglaciecola sp.]|uniref:putative porin n=1 Tax=Paraglaciecola sp. TaxID=1920173 RepID=UPI0030F469A3